MVDGEVFNTTEKEIGNNTGMGDYKLREQEQKAKELGEQKLKEQKKRGVELVSRNNSKYSLDHFPMTLRLRENVKYYNDGSVILIISNDLILSSAILSGDVEGAGVFHPEIGVFVDDFYSFIGFDKNWFLQPVGGKKVYVQKGGNLSRMSCSPEWYSISGNGKDILEQSVEIELSLGEKTMADVLKNSFKYYYNKESNKYVAHSSDDQVLNKFFFLLEKDITRVKGNASHRFKKMEILLMFLFKKMGDTFSEEEKLIFSFFLDKELDDKELVKIMDSEKLAEESAKKLIEDLNKGSSEGGIFDDGFLNWRKLFR
jgi:hypothetical protein